MHACAFYEFWFFSIAFEKGKAITRQATLACKQRVSFFFRFISLVVIVSGCVYIDRELYIRRDSNTMLVHRDFLLLSPSPLDGTRLLPSREGNICICNIFI